MQYTLLYEFSLGSRVWRYTANAQDVIDPNSNRWEAAAISSEQISTSGSATADTLNVTASVDLVPARIWMYSRPSKVMDIRIIRANLPDRVSRGDDEGVASDPVADTVQVSNLRVVYVGEVVQCSFDQPGTVGFNCETISATMQREGLRLVWQRSCPYVIYDPLTCGVNKAAFAVAAEVVNIDGNSVSLNVTLSGNYAGGILEYVHPLRGEDSMTIEVGFDATVVIFEGAEDLYVGQAVTVYRGCDQSPSSCSSFGNKPNYGGIEALPGKSPFNGLDGPIF